MISSNLFWIPAILLVVRITEAAEQNSLQQNPQELPSTSVARVKRQWPFGGPGGPGALGACPQGSFRCFNGQCIRFSCACDGKADCLDASDERMCGQQPYPAFPPGQFPPGQFPPGQFPPGQQQFPAFPFPPFQVPQPFPPMMGYPSFQPAIGQYPPQGMNLAGACNFNEFQCRSGHCLGLQCVCDSRPDCPDGSDELGCPTRVVPLPQPAVPPPQTTCPAGKFRCRTGQCIEDSQTCNGYFDCPYGEDEQLPKCQQRPAPQNPQPPPPINPVPPMNLCGPGNFQCRNGQCVAQACVCDGKPECLDYSDEIGCPPRPPIFGKKK